MPYIDFHQPPFDVLSIAERQSLKKHTQVRYLAAPSTLPDSDYDSFFLVLKGRIQQQLGDDVISTYLGANHLSAGDTHDWFDARRRPEPSSDTHAQPAPAYTYHASEDTLLLQVTGSAIDRLVAQNHLVRTMLSDNLSERLYALQQRRSPRSQASDKGQQEVQHILLQPITAIPLLPVQQLPATASLAEGAQVMIEAGLKHVLIQPPQSHSKTNSASELGILTDTDICRAVSEHADMRTTACCAYASFDLRTLTTEHDVGDALLAMTRYRVHRLPVIDAKGHVTGILGQSQLLAHISHHSQLISVQITQAHDIDSLGVAVDAIGRYIRMQQQQGVKVAIISRMVQTLNAHVFTKLWQLTVPDALFRRSCLIVMGSEGRGEQIMRTDQDNALILEDGYTYPNIEQYCARFNQALSTLGYPLCDGNIMMQNPLWRQSISDFKKQISAWFAGRDAMSGIYLSALLDAEYVCGAEHLLTELRAHLIHAHRQADPMFVRQFARAALQFGEINQWWQRFAPLLGKTHASDIDLKKAGIFPLVHGIRTLALEHDIVATPSTKDRLKALVQQGVLTAERAETLGKVLEFFMAQRLAVALSTQDRHAREVNPNTLSALERDVLKECLAVVKRFKTELRQRYQLEVI
ncbi:DUF294 nucleotidyltransferase-like domain-containing protein [Psychrobacter aestuarii]|uniref:Nucleotidyltransferase substrate binding domain-containing protein n=1 Tax=Psychrobacter aestuarii TaxID=556327 RepID=A0ABN0VLB1_9GAMM|nr:DUF294 nucleotidyltransferase-like domain-containing protein [Psychrobacter aestuarii]